MNMYINIYELNNQCEKHSLPTDIENTEMKIYIRKNILNFTPFLRNLPLRKKIFLVEKNDA